MPWVITQVSSAIAPLTIANQFYRIEYFFPAHHMWGVLMTIFSEGANNHLDINLTVMFMWLLIAVPFNMWAQKRRWMSFRRR